MTKQTLYALAAFALILLCAHAVQLSSAEPFNYIGAAACAALAGVCVKKGELWEVSEK